MATLYLKAAGGNWSAAGTWSNTGSGGGDSSGPPTAADDVIFEAGSGNVTIDAGAVCRSMDWTSGTGIYAGVATHTAGVTLTIGDGTAGAGNVALKLTAGATYTLGNAATSAINFVSTSATQQTITTATKTLGNWTISGAGSSYQLADANTVGVSATVTLTRGTLDTNNQTCSWGLFNSSNTNTRTLTLGSSAIAITAAASAWSVQVDGITITANTSVVTFSNGSVTMTTSTGVGQSLNYNGMSIIYNSTATLTLTSATLTFANVSILSGAGKNTFLQVTSPVINVTGTLTITGNSTVNRVLVAGNVTGTARTINAAVVSLTNVDWRDITAGGAAIPFTGTSMGNALGNTNITFDTPVTQTHTASAGGNWSDVTKWTTRVPLPQDNVIVDVNTTGTLTADMPRMGANIDFTGFAGTAAFSSVANSSFGNIILGAGMTISGTQSLTLMGRGAQTITSNGKQFTQTVNTNAPGGSYSLSDAFSSALDFATAGTAVQTFNTNNFAMSVRTFGSVTGSILNLGSSVISLTATTALTVINFSSSSTINAGTSEFIIVNASASTRTISLQTRTINILTYTVAGSTGTLVFNSAGTVGTLNFSDASNARTLQFTAATTTTFTGTFNVNGTPGNLISIQSVTAATHTLAKPTGIVSCDYLSITNSSAGGGATWYAGTNSVNVSGNSGWIFNAPPAGRGGFLIMFS